ncbi:helix-turn-helix domain-containing protein [Actinokineospora bangkokensis]|uniref:Transcriptional regulator n=1 Tax=Actinokineospora bangkokensis TaxID=1193682 RepID=A0A1Q9LQ32_9PSEU|nr:helix-turn-helix transcriptional regulator [Actinokineospora bangkokensis]OLR94132.1 transcriptional regulator [Actinokineospora bangkokensis]
MTGDGVAENVKAGRAVRRWTQQRFADLIGFSVSTVRKVEQGAIPASPEFVAKAARALDVLPEQLEGTPFLGTIHQDGALVGLADLRAVLAEGEHVRAVAPDPLARMVDDLERVNLLYRNDKGRQALAGLPLLIRKFHGALRDTTSDGERGRLHSCLASAFVTAERLCRRFGFTALAVPALDRLDWAAERADDPLYAAQARVKRCRVLMYLDSIDVGLGLAEQGIDLVHGDDEAALAVRGYGHLCGAIAAARGRRADTAWAHIAQARALARRVNGESDAYDTLFGAANVEIHACAVELEAGDPGKAARVGAELRLPEAIAPPRAGHHWQDTARGFLLAGDPGRALDALHRARRVAPQQTRLHPGVRETVRGIAVAQRRTSPSTAEFARWVGLGR